MTLTRSCCVINRKKKLEEIRFCIWCTFLLPYNSTQSQGIPKYDALNDTTTIVFSQITVDLLFFSKQLKGSIQSHQVLLRTTKSKKSQWLTFSVLFCFFLTASSAKIVIFRFCCAKIRGTPILALTCHQKPRFA